MRNPKRGAFTVEKMPISSDLGEIFDSFFPAASPVAISLKNCHRRASLLSLLDLKKGLYRLGPKKAMKATVNVDCWSTSFATSLWKKSLLEKSPRYSTLASRPSTHLYS